MLTIQNYPKKVYLNSFELRLNDILIILFQRKLHIWINLLVAVWMFVKKIIFEYLVDDIELY